ncbi:MAG: glycosyltransferase [Chloroflexota bacterium]|nr:glycosyltransferase [Chloroflexota bacterium]
MITHSSSRNRVLVISHDVISTNMAGPGIRSLELACVLSEELDVVLATPNECDMEFDSIRIHPYRYGDWESFKGALNGVDVILTTGFSLYEFQSIGELDIPIVVDLYDPFPLENLYLFEGSEREPLVHLTDLAIVDVMCTLGDFFLCATARQRDWWLGVLLAKGRINPPVVAADPSLRCLIDEMPFGFPARPFRGTGEGPRERLPEISPDDRLILWGGGLWNWLDPLTLIRAMPTVLKQEPRAKLLFPGTRHPNNNVPEMERTREALALAKRLGLLDRQVFFGDWVPYESWPAYLADADVAVSLHFDTLETQFSAMRSRVLSYIWARLPMVVTEGDEASRMVAEHGLGEVVPYGDVEQVSKALLRIMENGRSYYTANFDRLAQELTWQKVAQPLLAFCRNPQRAPDKSLKWVEAKRETAHLEGQHAQIRRQEEQIRHQEEQIQHLQETIDAYEQGRFMTLMRTLHQLRLRMLSRS